MFYQFRQNNSGGGFIKPAINVFIEADSAEEANTIATDHIYFDFEYEIDCDCCGMRWYPADEYCASEELPEPSEWDSGWAKGDIIPERIVVYKG